MKTINNTTGNGHKPIQQLAQSGLELLPLIMNNIPQAVFWKDRDLVYLGCNRAFAEDTGFSSPEEVIGKTDFDMPWKEQAELYRADDRLVMESGESKLNYEEPQTTPDGSTIWLSTSKIPMRENGQVVAVLGMYEDVTVRKRTEQAIKESEEKFKVIADNTAVGVFIYQDGIVRYVGREAARQLGYEVSETIGRSIMDFIHPDERQHIADMVRRRTARENVPDQYETRMLKKDGSALDVLMFGIMIEYEGKPATQGAFLDLTARKLAEQTLQESEARYSAVVNQTTEGVIIIQNNICQFVNEFLANMLGYAPAEMQNTPFINYLAPESRALVAGRIKIRLAGEEVPPVYEAKLQRKDGTVFDAELSAGVIQYRGSSADVGLIRDITERKRAEEALKQSEEKFRVLSDQSPNMTFINMNGRVVYANQACEQITGYTVEEFCSPDFNFISLIAPEHRGMVQASFAKHARGENVEPYDFTLVAKNGKRLEVIQDSRLIVYEGQHAILGICTDITERKQAEEAIRESEDKIPAIYRSNHRGPGISRARQDC